jgi:hypothetical protein
MMPPQPLRDTLDMKSTILSFVTAAIVVTQPHAHAVLGVGDIVSDPIAEEALIHKNIFDKLKYAWEQAQWADKLATLHDTLITVRQHLETANMVKQAIGDPVATIALIDNGLFSDFLQDSGITYRPRRNRPGGRSVISDHSRIVRAYRHVGVE